jgi:hypothetical protein
LFEPVGCEFYPSPYVTVLSWWEEERYHKLDLAQEVNHSIKLVGQRRFWFDGLLHVLVGPVRPDRFVMRGDQDLY